VPRRKQQREPPSRPGCLDSGLGNAWNYMWWSSARHGERATRSLPGPNALSLGRHSSHTTAVQGCRVRCAKTQTGMSRFYRSSRSRGREPAAKVVAEAEVSFSEAPILHCTGWGLLFSCAFTPRLGDASGRSTERRAPTSARCFLLFLVFYVLCFVCFVLFIMMGLRQVTPGDGPVTARDGS
jgi:hypothetical protein